MPSGFFAQRMPDSKACRRLMDVDPLNPFATPAYLEAEKSLGAEPWLLGFERDGSFTGCLAFIRSGRLNRSLTIPSAPDAPPAFWDGVKTFSNDERITSIEVNTFASPAAFIPELGEETSRMERFEFIVPLDGSPDQLLDRMRVNHRQSVRKGMKQGLTVRTGDVCSLETHIQLMAASMERRQLRGEHAVCEASVESLRPYVESGFCRLFQAVLDGQVVSSMTVACAPRAFYLHTSGTNATGMAACASHFLLYEIMKAGQTEQLSKFNLGGVANRNSSLAQYKERFGADVVRLEAAEFYTGNALHKAVSASARLMKNVLDRARTLGGGGA
jgi:hypothetical protein